MSLTQKQASLAFSLLFLLTNAFSEIRTGVGGIVQAAGAMNKGITFIVEIIFLTLGVYFAAFLLPGALTAIATVALTSVNAGVITIFQVVVPFTVVAVLVLLLISVIRDAIGM